MTTNPTNSTKAICLWSLFFTCILLTSGFVTYSAAASEPNRQQTETTLSPSPTATFISEITPQATIDPQQISVLEMSANTHQLTTTLLTDLFMPFIMLETAPTPPAYVPSRTGLFCDSLPFSYPIPDNSREGVKDTINILEPTYITDLDVALDIRHSWIGDLVVTLTHHDTGKMVVLLDRPGYPANSLGCDKDNIDTFLDDQISTPAEYKCASSPAAIAGIYLPAEPLSEFIGDAMQGSWTLTVYDIVSNSTGKLDGWCLIADTSPSPAPATPTPTVQPFPSSKLLNGVTGKNQALPLDCETRSAVDWANYLGRSINEYTFLNQLPKSDNPDKGFVGSVYGTWGQIPPDPYGVHAPPVAALLREYGLNAYAHRPLSWDQLRAEIAHGNPVIVWVIGNVSLGIPIYYTPSDGLATIVARYEHTVVVTGYSDNYVYYLNGDTIYRRTVGQFLDSWSALGNMAITTQP